MRGVINRGVTVFMNDVDIVMRVDSGFNYLNDPPRVETRPGILNNPR